MGLADITVPENTTMITTGAVDEDLIEQFTNDIQQSDSVRAVTRDGGRALKVTVTKNDDGIPKPQRELGDVDDGVIKCDDYVISKLAGGGHAPGNRYVFRVAVSPYCTDCGDQPQKGLDDDDTRCSDCAFGDNLLTGTPGETYQVEAGDDVWGIDAEPGDTFYAEADDDGLLRGADDRVFNDGRYHIVDGVDR